jgi:arsenate reductase (thioredoxin)
MRSPEEGRRPQVLFLCVHNAGRSQMAAGFMRLYGAGAVDVRTGGSTPADEVNPFVVEAMAETGVDLSEEIPRRFDDDDVREADVVVTMGCGDSCPVFPGKRYLDWDLTDPSGLTLEQIRPIRDEIARRVLGLLAELVPSSALDTSA